MWGVFGAQGTQWGSWEVIPEERAKARSQEGLEEQTRSFRL